MNRAAIAALIPHRGAMCLLAGVQEWDAQQLVCTATNHRDANHPLRTRRGLLAGAAIEYAAQAMALHGALTGRAGLAEGAAVGAAVGAAAGAAVGASAARAATPGYLASARSVQLHVLRLDNLPVAPRPDELRIRVVRAAGDAQQILYTFDVSHAGRCVAAGRAAVVLNASLRTL